MAAVQTASPVSILPSSVTPRESFPTHRRRVKREPRPLTLEQQGIREDWFTRGLQESNCALFHASLYDVLPLLKERIQVWLESSSVDSSLAEHPLTIADFALGVIDLAFQEGHQWKQDQAVVDWLASFIPVVYAESDPASSSL